tara:strand:- start:103 stop:210 length:108 start_codon:yes stop_codon:yes gene_type:complete
MNGEDLIILGVFACGFMAILAVTLVIDAIMRRFED